MADLLKKLKLMLAVDRVYSEKMRPQVVGEKEPLLDPFSSFSFAVTLEVVHEQPR